MSDLINGKDLYEKIADLEADMRKKLLSTPRDSEAYIRYVERLNERSFFKHEIMDAPRVETEPQWIPCSERLPEEGEEVLITTKTSDKLYFGMYAKRYGFSMREGFICGEDFMWISTAVAWMPLPQPYKGIEE